MDSLHEHAWVSVDGQGVCAVCGDLDPYFDSEWRIPLEVEALECEECLRPLGSLKERDRGLCVECFQMMGLHLELEV